MKKNKLSIFFSLFLLTFTSCNSFLLQDQTSISISIDSQEINNALRSVDYSIEESYILSRLTGNKGFFQEEQFIINDDDYNFTLKNIPYGQTYTLQFYIVSSGSTFLYGCQENISLTKAQNVLELEIIPQGINFYVDKINIDFYPTYDQVQQGSYFMKADISDSQTYYFDSFNEDPYITLSARIIVPDNFSQKNAYFLISHNKKSEKINCELYYEDSNAYGNTYRPIQYYFTETGNYTIKYFAFDTNNCFATKTITLYVGKNEIDTDIYLYDLVSNDSHNVYLDNSLTENTSQTNNIFNDSSTNNFDFCLDKVGNIYLTDGYSIYKNNQNNNIASTYGNIKKIKFDYSTNKLYAWVQSNYINYFFEIDTAGYKAMEINPDYQFTESFDDFVISNSVLYTISYNRIKAYSFVSKLINYNHDYHKVLAINAISDRSTNYNANGDINDSILIDNKIYILRSYVETNLIYFDSPDCKSSIVIYDITKDSYEAISNTYSEDTTISSPVFINPKKIIAIKPKELIIADDGLLFDTKKRTYRNSNRVLSFSLDGSNGSDSIKLMKILNKIKLNEEHDKTINGCGCSDYTYDPE